MVRPKRWMSCGRVVAPLVGLVVSASGCGGPSPHRPPTSTPRPNIVMVLVDDLRWDEFGLGGHPYAETPHVDRLATEGVMFTVHHEAELYDLVADSLETRNLIDDPAMASVAAGLRRELARLSPEALGL